MTLPTSALNITVTTLTHRIKQSLASAKWEQVISNYITMTKSGIKLTDTSLYPSLIKASSKLSFIQGQLIHACSLKRGYDSFISVQNSLLDFYMKWGGPIMGLTVFNTMINTDCVTWNILINGYFCNSDLDTGLCLFLHGRVLGFEPNVSTLVFVARAYRGLGGLDEGRMFHGYVLRSGFLGIDSVRNSLLGVYVDCDFECAHKVFDEMLERDVVCWSLMIGGCVQNEVPEVGLRMFRDMLGWVDPDGLTMVSVLRACSSLGDSNMGRSLHGCVIVRGHKGDVFVSNSLVDLYSRCSDTVSAFRVFDEMGVKNIVSWNSILWGMVHNGMHSEAVSVVKSMVQKNVEVDEVTFINLLQLCKHLLEPNLCKLIHARVIRCRYDSNIPILSSLIDTYSKFNLIETAWKLFSMTNDRDTVTWASMIGGFACCGMPDEAMTVFKQMNELSVRANHVVLLNLIEACAVFAELKRCKWAHCIAIRTHFVFEVSIGTAIVDMYSKCGAVELARNTFDQITHKNIMSWSSMISGYGMNGQAQQALALVNEMKLNGSNPNEVTALSVLAACSHGGLVNSGLSFFQEMVSELGIQPSVEHYACLIDMLSRAGKLENAIELIKNMPENFKDGGASVWGAVLSASTRYKNTDIGEEAGSRVLELETFGSSGYLLFSSLYAGIGSWVNAAKMRWLVKEKGVRVLAGYSSVHVGDRAYKFVAGDKSKPQAVESCAIVERLHKCMRIDVNLDEVLD